MAKYKYTYSSGLFAPPQNETSLDWAALNNTRTSQSVQVTVFKCRLGKGKKAEPPDAITVDIGPYETTHNANRVDPGFYYEVEIKCNSRKILPMVSSWEGSGGTIPGTEIRSADFIRTRNR